MLKAHSSILIYGGRITGKKETIPQDEFEYKNVRIIKMKDTLLINKQNILSFINRNEKFNYYIDIK